MRVIFAVVLFISLTYVDGLATCNPSPLGLPSPYLNPLDKSCTIQPDRSDAVTNLLTGKLEVIVVVTNNVLGKTSIKCVGLNCADFLKLYAAGQGSTDIDCSVKDGCRDAMIQIGEPEYIPDGFDLNEFTVAKRGVNDYVDVDCLGIGSCIGTTISVVGDYPGGVKVTAIGKDSFDGASLICNLKEGQTCKLICDESTSCDGSTVVCMGRTNCQCIGNACPIVIFPEGSDPDNAKSIGESPNVPGLQCIAGTDDNPPDECRFSPLKKANAQGNVICSENYDCCLCSKIQCDDCTAVVCNGDQSCIGVEIEINGNEKMGAQLNCNGDDSCKFGKVIAEGLTAIKADGDLSLMGSEMILNQNESPDSKLNALSVPCNGDGSCMLSTILAKNVLKFNCDGDYSCFKTNVLIESKVLGRDKGGSINCGGDKSCSESSWEAFGVVAFSANGDEAASKNEYNFTMVEAGGPFGCGGDLSCAESKFNLYNIGTLKCAGDRACEKTLYKVLGALPFGCGVVCGGESSCINALWNIYNANSFSCQGPSSCKYSNVNVECLNDGKGCPLICGGVEACYRLNVKIINVGGLTCSGVFGCKNTNIDMKCISPGEDKGCLVECTADSSCYELQLTSNNVGGVICVGTYACHRTKAKLSCAPGKKGCAVRCNGPKSCIESIFDIDNVGEIACQGRNACVNTTMNMDCAQYGCPVICQGIGPCIDAELIVNNAQSLTCTGSKSCLKSDMTLYCKDDLDGGCDVVCGSTDSCALVNYDIVNSGGISCSRDACFESNFTFSNNKGGSLSCVGPRACTKSTFNRLDNLIDVTCSGNSACKNSNIYGSCGVTGCSLTCTGFECCQGSTIDIGNVKEFKCDNTDACNKADILIRTSNKGFKGTCATESCKDTKITIKSETKNNEVSFDCVTVMSCQGSTIIFDGSDFIDDKLLVKNLMCGGAYACKNTKFILKNAIMKRSTYESVCAGLYACTTDLIHLICQDSYGNTLDINECLD